MSRWLSRTELLLGADNLARLASARGAVLGLGGVGGAAAEALCRCGVGRLMVVDSDRVEESNLNRQLLATRPALGQSKCQAARERLLAVNPALDLACAEEFYLPGNSGFLFEWKPHFVIDAIDTVTAKLHLAEECAARGIYLISSMGTGNRLDPSRLRLGDICDTAGCGCPLARVMRRELKKRGVGRLPVVYSLEPPLPGVCAGDGARGRHSPGSSAFVPPAAGYLLASAAVRAFLALPM